MFAVVRDKAIVALHRAKTAKQLSLAVFDLFSEVVPNHSQILVLSSGMGSVEGFCSGPETEWCETQSLYIAVSEDIPTSHLESPLQVFSRKSKTQPLVAQRHNQVYRSYMAKCGSDHAVTLFVGRPTGWHARLTIFRTPEQGPFTEKEWKDLHSFRPYLQSTIERVVGQGEDDLIRHTLEMFVWSLPSAVILLNWDMKVLYFNASARELAECWKSGTSYPMMKKTKTMTPPDDIVAALAAKKSFLTELTASIRSTQKTIFLSDIRHPSVSGFVARTYFYPHHATSTSGGAFLISLHRQCEVPDKQQTYNGFASLSPRERDVVHLAAQGKKSNEIGDRLGTASITVRMQLCSAYKKLGINSRYELMNLFAHHSTAANLPDAPDLATVGAETPSKL